MYSKRYKNETGKTRYIKPKKCKECGLGFNPSKPLQTYCSYRCSNLVGNRSKLVKAQKQLTCLACKTSFTKRASDLTIYPGSLAKNKYRYCSRSCWKNSKQTTKSLKIKAWGAFSLYIRNRDGWTCFTCDKRETGAKMHAGHFISRSHSSTLFDEKNVHAQCASCNMFRNGQPHIYAERIIKNYGLEEFNNLLERGKTTKKLTKQELITIYEKYVVAKQ